MTSTASFLEKRLRAHWVAVFFTVLLFFFGLFSARGVQADSYNSFTLDDLSVTHSDTSLGGSDNMSISFTMPFAMTTSGYISVTLPSLYGYDSNNNYVSEYVNVTNATVTSNQLTVSYQSESSLTFYPTAALNAGDVVSISIMGAQNPATLEGSSTVSLYGSESTGTDYNYFSGSSTVVYGTVDLTVTTTLNDGTTPVENVYVSLSYYDPNDWTVYETFYGYTDSSGQAYFSGLTENRTYSIYFSYDGNATTQDAPSSTSITYTGGSQSASYNFIAANVITHFEDQSGQPVENAYWYFYKTDFTDYTSDYVSRWGYTDSTGLISGAAERDGSYTLYIYSDGNYYSYDFTISGGVESGLEDPITQPIPEVTGTIMAGSSPAANVYVWIHDSGWNTYRYDYTDANGQFDFALGTSGTYTIEVSNWDLPAGYFSPDPVDVSVTAGVPNSAITLSLVTASKTISGTVTMQGDSIAKVAAGTPVDDAGVYAYQSGDTYRYAYTTTGADGTFTLPVTGGEWKVYLYPTSYPADWAYSGDALTATFANNTTAETANFNVQVQPFNSHIVGKVVYPDGTAVEQYDVYLYAHGGEDNSVYSYTYTEADGTFDLRTTEGSFEVFMYFYGSGGVTNYAVPSIDTQTLSSGETVDIGTVTLIEKTSHIQGRVSISDTNETLSDVWVYAYKQKDGWDWAGDATDENGQFDLLVGPGEWSVYLFTWGITTNTGQSVIYTGGALDVTIADAQTLTGYDFSLRIADSTISFETQTVGGQTIDTETGWANVSEADGEGDYGWYSLGAYISRGTGTVDVASGVPYAVTYYSYNNYGWSDADTDTYTYSHMLVDGQQADSVTLPTDSTKNVVLVMALNDVTVSGQFLDTDGNPVEIYGEVYARNENGGWAYTYVDGESSYTMKISAGTWSFNYWTWGGDWTSFYNTAGNTVTVQSGASETVNFSVLNNDATVSGTVLDPEGNVYEGAFIKVSTNYGTSETDTQEEYGLIEQTTYSGIDGTFSITVPSGEYYVTASSAEYLDPQPVLVTANAEGSAEGLTIQFVEPDATITGRVLEGGQGIQVNNRSSVAVGDPVPSAFVYGFSVNGGSVFAETDANGVFTLPVSQGTTWYVGSIYEAESIAYYSDQTTVEVNEDQESQDLSLSNQLTIPEPQTRRFDPREAQVIDMGDGARVEIPANSITTDEDVDQVTVTIEAIMEMVYEPGIQPVKLGYQITAIDQNGNLIDQLSGNIKITFPYDDDSVLGDAGLDEGALKVGYFDDATDAWQTVTSVVCDSTENECTMNIDHLSTFAIVSNKSALVTNQDGDEINLGEGILSAPENVRVSKRFTKKAMVKWNEVSAADSYTVRVKSVKTDKVVKRATAKKTKKLMKALKPNTKYVVQVRSVSDAGSQSAWSEEVQFRTKPKAPTAVTAKKLTSDSVKLQWKKVRGKIQRYIVRLYKDGGKNVLETKRVKNPRVLLKQLDADTRYFIQINARFNKKNSSGFSKEFFFRTLAE